MASLAGAQNPGHQMQPQPDVGPAVCPHGRNLAELGYLTDLGMTPIDAIVAGTRTSAELLGVAEQLGTVVAGKLADIIICDGDPLADVSVLGDPGRIRCVIQGGVIRKDLLADRD